MYHVVVDNCHNKRERWSQMGIKRVSDNKWIWDILKDFLNLRISLIRYSRLKKSILIHLQQHKTPAIPKFQECQNYSTNASNKEKYHQFIGKHYHHKHKTAKILWQQLESQSQIFDCTYTDWVKTFVGKKGRQRDKEKRILMGALHFTL